LRRTKAITIYDARTGCTEPTTKAIKEGRGKTGVEVISKWTANTKTENPQDIDDQQPEMTSLLDISVALWSSLKCHKFVIFLTTVL
jgi:hypothetical protein